MLSTLKDLFDAITSPTGSDRKIRIVEEIAAKMRAKEAAGQS